MFRRTVVVVGMMAASLLAAHAETWMVKSATLGCETRETLVELDRAGAPQTSDDAPRAGCVVLDAGERLLEQHEIGMGFSDTMKMQRRDGSLVFVRSSVLVLDPGIGSAIEDRP